MHKTMKKINLVGLRSFGNNRLKITWARPRTRSRSQRYDPNMKCFKCGQRGHLRYEPRFSSVKFQSIISSRECERIAAETRSTHRRDHSSSNSRRHSRYGLDLFLGE